MITHLWAYKIICIFLYSYLLAKAEIFYMLNSFIVLAKRNSFFILKDQFSPVFTFISDIRLLLTKNIIKLHFVLCQLLLSYKSLQSQIICCTTLYLKEKESS